MAAKTTRSGYINIQRPADKQFFFTIHASNRATLLTSETYKRKENCKKGIAALTRLFLNKKTIAVYDLTISNSKR